MQQQHKTPEAIMNELVSIYYGKLWRAAARQAIRDGNEWEWFNPY